MASFNDLPDELLVKIFCSLRDHDPTKIRLERVSSRFYGCLRESWKHSRILDLNCFNTLKASAAFLDRVPEITHLQLIAPEDYKPEKLQQLYQNVHKLRISTLQYRSGDEDDSDECFTNAQLVVWCVSNFAQYLNTLDFECCKGETCWSNGDDISCKALDALVRLLPSCRNLQHVKLSQIHRTEGSLFDALAQLKLKSLKLEEDVAYFNFEYGGLARLLNFQPCIESVSVPPNDDDDEYVDFLGKFSQLLNEGAGSELRSLSRLPIADMKHMEVIGSIQNHLPKLRNLTVDFVWRGFDKENERHDASQLVFVIVEFIALGKLKHFDISFDLTVSRERESEYNFGEAFINQLLTFPGVRIKRNHDPKEFERNAIIKIVDKNVRVCIELSINDLYAKRKQIEDERVRKELLEWFAMNGI